MSPIATRAELASTIEAGFGTSLEVGYQSLSHFAKAFREETGESPSKWLGRQR